MPPAPPLQTLPAAPRIGAKATVWLLSDKAAWVTGGVPKVAGGL